MRYAIHDSLPLLLGDRVPPPEPKKALDKYRDFGPVLTEGAKGSYYDRVFTKEYVLQQAAKEAGKKLFKKKPPPVAEEPPEEGWTWAVGAYDSRPPPCPGVYRATNSDHDEDIDKFYRYWNGEQWSRPWTRSANTEAIKIARSFAQKTSYIRWKPAN